MKPSRAGALIDKRNSMKYNKDSHAKEALDAQIAIILLKEEINKAKHFVQFCNSTGTFPLQKMWKLKRELWPKKAPSLPVAKINHKGRLITSPRELMLTLKKEYQDRLRPRKCKEELKEHIELMHKVTQLKLSKAWENKGPEFTMEELDQGLKDLNRGRARDPQGLCAEIFKSNVMGVSMKISLLEMLNNIKEEGIIPDIMKESIVITIPKPGSKFELQKLQGNFQTECPQKHIDKTRI